MDLAVLIAFAGMAGVLIAVPGPDWAFILAAGVREQAVLPAVTGLVAGYLVLTVVVAAGVGPLVASVPAALVALTVVGAGYLIHVGIGTVRSPRRDPPVPATGWLATGPRNARLVRRGIGVSALNPKALLFFLAFLPQFARPHEPWPLPLQLTVLGIIWATIVGVFYCTLGFTADRVLASRPAMIHWVTRTAGVAMIAVGLALLVEQLR